jgi:hypothetical protein
MEKRQKDHGWKNRVMIENERNNEKLRCMPFHRRVGSLS